MSSYSASRMYRAESERMVLVRSDKCTYQVWIDEDQVRLNGPGVHEITDNEFEEFMDIEDLGIHIVILFENGLWP